MPVLAAPLAMPTAPFTALERRRSEFLFQTAVVLSAAAGPAAFWYHSSHVLDHGEAWEQEAMYTLVNAAAEPLMRRLVHVRGELRFSFARLASLFGAGEPAPTDVVANAFRATRFRIEDLPRLLAGLRIPETFIACGHRFLGEEGLLVMLVRLAFPGRNSVLAATLCSPAPPRKPAPLHMRALEGVWEDGRRTGAQAVPGGRLLVLPGVVLLLVDACRFPNDYRAAAVSCPIRVSVFEIETGAPLSCSLARSLSRGYYVFNPRSKSLKFLGWP